MKDSVGNKMASLLAMLLLLGASTAADSEANSVAQRLRNGRKMKQSFSSLPNHNVDEECCLDITLSCKVYGEDLPEQDCESFSLPLLTLDSPCKATPVTTTLLYNGGDCSQTDSADLLGITCQDGLSASPPTAEGDESYIVVTDAHNKGISYYEGWVAVGTNFVLDDGTKMEHGFVIEIFDSDDKEERNLLQKVFYELALCSSQVEMLNRFGASQLVGYTDEFSREISPFSSFSYDIKLDVTLSLTGTTKSATLEHALFTTNFADLIDLTDLGYIDANHPVTVSIPIDIDLFESKRNTLLAQISAIQNEGDDGTVCSGVTFLSFYTGGRLQG